MPQAVDRNPSAKAHGPFDKRGLLQGDVTQMNCAQQPVAPCHLLRPSNEFETFLRFPSGISDGVLRITDLLGKAAG